MAKTDLEISEVSLEAIVSLAKLVQCHHDGSRLLGGARACEATAALARNIESWLYMRSSSTNFILFRIHCPCVSEH